MSGAEIPLPALVAFLNAVQDDLKNPRYLEHPNFGRLRLVPMPAPLPSLWFGHSTPLKTTERAQRDRPHWRGARQVAESRSRSHLYAGTPGDQ